MKTKILILALVALTGCAYLRSTTETQTDPKTGLVTSRTVVRAFTVFDAQAQLSKFRNSTGGPTNTFTMGTTVGSVNEQSSASNIVAIIEAAAAAAGRAGF